MSDIDLTLAINHYDHVQDMATGAVKAEGIKLYLIKPELKWPITH